MISLSTDKPKRVVANGTAPSPALKPTQPDGFISRRHRSVSKDRVLLKRLEALVAEGKHDGEWTLVEASLMLIDFDRSFRQ